MLWGSRREPVAPPLNSAASGSRSFLPTPARRRVLLVAAVWGIGFGRPLSLYASKVALNEGYWGRRTLLLKVVNAEKGPQYEVFGLVDVHGVQDGSSERVPSTNSNNQARSSCWKHASLMCCFAGAFAMLMLRLYISQYEWTTKVGNIMALWAVL